MTVCQRCHRPLKHAAAYGPVCAKKVAPAPTGERDLFRSSIATDVEGALLRLHLGIAVMAAAARNAVTREFDAARRELKVAHG